MFIFAKIERPIRVQPCSCLDALTAEPEFVNFQGAQLESVPASWAP
jgi:hypothetical protein